MHSDPAQVYPISPTKRYLRTLQEHNLTGRALPAPSLSLHGRMVCLIFHCARPTRAFSGRALREHRRSTDHPSLFPPSSLVSLIGGWPGRSSTARVERGPSNSLRPLKRSGRGCPLLRASSEHVFIARSASKKGTWPLLPHPSEAARCASTEDLRACPVTPIQAHTPSPLLFLRTIDTGPARPPGSEPLR